MYSRSCAEWMMQYFMSVHWGSQICPVVLRHQAGHLACRRPAGRRRAFDNAPAAATIFRFMFPMWPALDATTDTGLGGSYQVPGQAGDRLQADLAYI
jgi:hypothetical protein